MKASAFHRPSSLNALRACPGYSRMSAAVVDALPEIDRLPSPAADKGTLLHARIAEAHKSGRPVFGPDSLQGEPWMRDLSAYDQTAVRRCLAYIGALLRSDPAAYTLTEERLDGTNVGLPNGGTADLILVSLGKVVVVDWKTGFLDQGHAADSMQLAAYAVMAFDRWHLPVDVHMAQPRQDEALRFTAASFQTDDIEQLRREILDTVQAACMPNSPITPHMDACRYARCLVMCKPARERFMAAAKELELFGPPTTPEERVKLAEAAEIAARFVAQVKALQKLWTAEQQAVQV